MQHRISCPSCSMNASRTDLRHFAPVAAVRGTEARRCRNCGETVLLDESMDFADLRPEYSSAS